jgi:DNA polymerase delta subunit 2
MPQQAMNPCLFPQSYILPSFNSVTNPHDCSIEGVSFLGTSGQPIDNIYRYTKPTSRLRCLEDTLRWRHLAPTAPDTLGCYPFEDQDPFVIHSCPHVYFAGNQPEFDTSLIEGEGGQLTRLILVPSFAETKTIVLLNLDTLDCHPIKFQTF